MSTTWCTWITLEGKCHALFFGLGKRRHSPMPACHLFDLMHMVKTQQGDAAPDLLCWMSFHCMGSRSLLCSSDRAGRGRKRRSRSIQVMLGLVPCLKTRHVIIPNHSMIITMPMSKLFHGQGYHIQPQPAPMWQPARVSSRTATYLTSPAIRTTADPQAGL